MALAKPEMFSGLNAWTAFPSALWGSPDAASGGPSRPLGRKDESGGSDLAALESMRDDGRGMNGARALIVASVVGVGSKDQLEDSSDALPG